MIVPASLNVIMQQIGNLTETSLASFCNGRAMVQWVSLLSNDRRTPSLPEGDKVKVILVSDVIHDRWVSVVGLSLPTLGIVQPHRVVVRLPGHQGFLGDGATHPAALSVSSKQEEPGRVDNAGVATHEGVVALVCSQSMIILAC